MRVVIQKVDMDTALTALLLGVVPGDRVDVVPEQATPADLGDASVLCIECGGSGDVARGNFDHHDTLDPFPPACCQALERLGADDAKLVRLVRYVAAIDTGDRVALGSVPGYPTLSNVFSGLCLATADPVEQLFRGMDLFRTVLDEAVDPFGVMPDRPEWREYLAVKDRDRAQLHQ